MGFRRRRVGALATIAAVALMLLATSTPGVAGSLDACAQRVIRDWYSGGRVDGVYPLGCYRAALRALPDDVLQYSNADQDIRRALAFARSGRDDPGTKPLAAAPAPPTEKRAQPASPPRPAPVANEAAPPVRKARLVPARTPATASVPYPIVALAALAGVLLATGAAGWLAGRRR